MMFKRVLRRFWELPDFVPLETRLVGTVFPELVLRDAAKKIGLVRKLPSMVPDFKVLKPPEVDLLTEGQLIPSPSCTPIEETYPLQWFSIHFWVPYIFHPDVLLERYRQAMISVVKDVLFSMFKSGELPVSEGYDTCQPIIAYSDCTAKLVIGVKPRKVFCNRSLYFLMKATKHKFALRGELFVKVSLNFRIASRGAPDRNCDCLIF